MRETIYYIVQDANGNDLQVFLTPQSANRFRSSLDDGDDTTIVAVRSRRVETVDYVPGTLWTAR